MAVTGLCHSPLGNQQGYSAIAMVMMLMLFGMLMLNGLNQRLSHQLKIDTDERHYFKHYNQAASALEWGFTREWPDLSFDWFCQNNQGQRVCIKRIESNKTDSGVLIKSEPIVDNSADKKRFGIRLYQLARERQASEDSVENMPFERLPHGWLDYCPLRDETKCD